MIRMLEVERDVRMGRRTETVYDALVLRINERIDSHTIRVRYDHCECDLVKCGLITSPIICECSAHNLVENFEQSLGTSVAVAIESSILRGEHCCAFVVSLEE